MVINTKIQCKQIAKIELEMLNFYGLSSINYTTKIVFTLQSSHAK